MSYNKIILVGHCTRDIELRYTPTGTAIAKTGLAVNRRFKGQNGEQKDETMFIDLTFFGRTAEIANQHLNKGKKILVEGRLVLDQWTDQNGQNRSKHSIAVENIEFLDKKEVTVEYKNANGETIKQETYQQRTENYGNIPYETPSSPLSRPVPQKNYAVPAIDIDDDIPI